MLGDRTLGVGVGMFLILFYLPVAEDRAELVEINHFYSEDGMKTFDQVIFYDWDDKACRFQVVDWRLIKKGFQCSKDVDRNLFVTTWLDHDQHRKVVSPLFRETWTQVDPELQERHVFPQDRRRKLYAKP